ncbi:MAG: DUF1559 domain-containing protein [Planctomycetia bacterium]|nr:DUF1559 domain-containing protein [Planctomycetia bacterium]
MVIAIIGILIALLLPAVQAAREAARRMDCTNRIKQVALSCHNYHDVHNMFPNTYHNEELTTANRKNPVFKSFSWICGILPFMEQNSLFDNIDFGKKPSDYADGCKNAEVFGTGIATLICPSDSGPYRNLVPAEDTKWAAGYATYYPEIMPWSFNKIWGPDHDNTSGATCYKGICTTDIEPTGNSWLGHFGYDEGIFSQGYYGVDPFYPFEFECRFSDVLDGTSNTLMIGESTLYWNALGSWGFYQGALCIADSPGYPINKFKLGDPKLRVYYRGYKDATAHLEQYDLTVSSLHSGGANVAMADGSVRFISETINGDTWKAMASKAGSETVSF